MFVFKMIYLRQRKFKSELIIQSEQNYRKVKTISERQIGILIIFIRQREEYQIVYQGIFGLSKLEKISTVAENFVVQLVFKVRG